MPTRAATGAPGVASDDGLLRRMRPDGRTSVVPSSGPRRAVAIVTGGCTPTGRDVAQGLAAWGWAIVVVYLEDQREAEVTATAIVAAGGTTVAVRADLADDLDVERLFTESIAAFGGVDVVIHTTTAGVGLLYEQAAQHVRTSGAIVSVSTPEQMAPGVARRLRDRDITVGRAPPDEVLSFLDQWRQTIV